MNKRIVLLILSVLTVGFVHAGGAGGVEVTQPWNQELWPDSGRVTGIGGLGYGVLDNGSVVGGFGMGVTGQAGSFHAGYGGVVQGWQKRWGPLVGTFTTKVGFGGAVWSPANIDTAGFSMLGMAEAELGVLMFPWFDIGIKGGVASTITFLTDEPFRWGWAPVVGLRLTWGAY